MISKDILKYYWGFIASCGCLQGAYYDIVVSRHAFIRAMQRGVSPDIIEAVLQTGAMSRFGKNRVKFTKKCRKMDVNCVDEIIGRTIKILTITKKVKR